MGCSVFYALIEALTDAGAPLQSPLKSFQEPRDTSEGFDRFLDGITRPAALRDMSSATFAG